MDVIKEQEDILRLALTLHVKEFLNGKEPLYLSEITSTRLESKDYRTLRRRYDIVMSVDRASHVSYLGVRDIVIENRIVSTGAIFTNKTMRCNTPLPKGLMRRARNFYEANPDISSEAIADLVLTEHSLDESLSFIGMVKHNCKVIVNLLRNAVTNIKLPRTL